MLLFDADSFVAIAVLAFAIAFIFAVILVVFALTFVVKVFMLLVLLLILLAFVVIKPGNEAMVEELTPPTLLMVVVILPFPEPLTSPVNEVVAFAAITSVPMTNPKLALAPAAVEEPVPPFVTATTPVTFVAFPVTFPVNGPLKPAAVIDPLVTTLVTLPLPI